jgi:hypothetical protein
MQALTRFYTASAISAFIGLASPCLAQTPAQSGSGNYSNTYTAPNWGQVGSGSWGTQSGNIGQDGWQYHRTPQANQPAGNNAYPNATSRPFGSQSDSYNPLTSRGRRF